MNKIETLQKHHKHIINPNKYIIWEVNICEIKWVFVWFRFNKYTNLLIT